MDEPPVGATRRDPFFAAARFGGADRRWSIIAVLAAVNAIAFVVLPVAANVEADLATDVQRLRILAGLVWALVGVPTGLVIYFWFPESLARLVPEMRARGVLADPLGRPVLDDLAEEMSRRMADVRWLLVGLAAVIVSASIFAWFPDRTAVPDWLKLIQVLAAAPLVFGASVLICRLVSGTAGTVKVLQQAVPRVIPLHGDDAGGWGPFGHRAAVLGRAAAVYGLVAVLVNIGTIQAGGDPATLPTPVATLAAFLVLPPLVLWAWLFTPHRAMLTARERAIGPIAEAFESEATEGISRAGALTEGTGVAAAEAADVPPMQDGTTALKSGSDRLDELTRRRAQLVDAYPVWPLRLIELRAVWVTAFLPILTAVVGSISEWAAGWFG